MVVCGVLERNFYFVTIWFSKKNESSKNILFWFFTFFLSCSNMRAPGGSCCFYFLFLITVVNLLPSPVVLIRLFVLLNMSAPGVCTQLVCFFI